ncbi:class I SAM-dependent methyltransferase [Candidatus Cytomitobacter primus]|nr:hypothetical protein [Candidatus Cytomitobacter primus]
MYYPNMMAWSCGRSRKLKSNIEQDYAKYLYSTNKINEIINMHKENRRICLDIGFGAGDSIIQTLMNGKSIVIGCEIFKPAIFHTLTRVEDKDRVFLCMAFINDLIQSLPLNSFDEIKMLCPDPWPKYKHRMRRCYNIRKFDLEIVKILKKEGIFTLASDIKSITQNMVNLFNSPYFDIAQNEYTTYDECPHKTEYCKKGFNAGRHVYEMIARKSI